MEAFSQQRHKLCSFLKSVDASNHALGESDDLPILPHLVQRLHKLMSDEGGSYLDKLVLHCLMRDTIKLDDSSFQKFIDDVREKSHGKGSHAKTINKALRRIIATDRLVGITDKVRGLSWKTREGLKHDWPTMCDYCDFIAAVAEAIGVPYRSVYSAFGDSYGHYHVLQGKLPVSGTTYIGNEQPRYDLRNFGIKWTDIKGEVSPQGSKSAGQVRKTVKVEEIQRQLDIATVDIPSCSTSTLNVVVERPRPETPDFVPLTSFRPIEPVGSPSYNPTSPIPVPATPLTIRPAAIDTISVLHSPPAQTPLRTKISRAKRRLFDPVPSVEIVEPTVSDVVKPDLSHHIVDFPPDV